MGEARRKKQNQTSTGVVVGILLPAIIFVLIYLFRYNRYPFIDFVRQLAAMNMLIKLFSLCGIGNLVAFYYFYRRQMDRAAKGVVAATFLYGLAVLAMKVF